MFSRQGNSAIKKDLANTLKLCDILGNPQNNFKSIHIAGTNGKGSSAHMLTAILQKSGYHTGLYTSPHLVDFRERIRVDGLMIEKNEVIEFCNLILPHISSVHPSFFELSVAMAFHIFSKRRVDIAVIETGLGGRLDSTNVIMPEVALITNIGMDHMDILGDSLEKIAAEKAGIIKQDVPVVISERQEETDTVFETVGRQMNSPVIFATDLRRAEFLGEDRAHTAVRVTHQISGESTDYELDLRGHYQLKNILGVLAVTDLMNTRGFLIPNEAITKALQNVRAITQLSGRWQTLMQHPKVICDTAHNKPGWQEIMTHLKNQSYNKLHIVIGIMRDKDVGSLLNLLPKSAIYYFCSPGIERALDATQLAKAGETFSLTGTSYPSVHAAIAEALDQAHKDDLIFIGGSTFVVGEALEKFKRS